MSWKDPERVETLKKLWAEGLSCSLIAARMGGITRNAVIGKVHRLGLGGRVTADRRAYAGSGKRRQRRPRPAKAVPQFQRYGNPALRRLIAAEPHKPAPVVDVPEHERKALLELEHGECKWPYGDGPFTFCARHAVTGLPYCDAHARIAFAPPNYSPRVARTLETPAVLPEFEDLKTA